MKWICKDCGNEEPCTVETSIVDELPCRYCVKHSGQAHWRKETPTVYAIDFDGTIVENRWPSIGARRLEIINFIKLIQQRGDKWILWTMREGKKLDEAKEFLADHDLYPDAVNDNLPELCEAFGNNPRKVFAHVYIDDHNAGGLQWCLPKEYQLKNG